jgi:hypothetical protein
VLAVGVLLSKVPAKVELFARGKADNQICTALLQPLTRACTPWHRSQFWLALSDSESEFCT